MDFRIETTNFMRLKNVDITFNEPVSIVAGLNEAGKSSLAEAIRFCLLGDTPRVKLKKDYKYLIHDGARSGSVTLTLGDQVITRNVRDGKASGDSEKYGGMDDDMLKFALGCRSFALATPEKRREIVTRYTANEDNSGELIKQLQDAKIDPAKLNEIRPLLSHSFDSAHKRASENYSKARGAWETITDERFGSKKGNWSPDLPNVKTEIIAALQDDLNSVNTQEREQLEALQQKIGQLKAMGNITISPDNDDHIFDLQESLRDLNSELRMAESTLICPECGSELQLEKRKLVNQEHTSRATETVQNEIEALQITIEDEKRAIQKKAEENRAARDAEANKEIAKIQTEIDEVREKYRAQRASVEDDLVQYTNDRDKAIDLKARMERAKKTHKTAMEWLELRDLLGEKGDSLRSSIAVAGTELINTELQNLGHFLGMRPVTIEADMAIRRTDGRPYELLSESARWRVSAMLSMAMAKIAGIPIIILDRMDVINVRDRVDVLSGISAWMSEYDGKVVTFATLKDKPTKAPIPNCELFWLDEGAVR